MKRQLVEYECDRCGDIVNLPGEYDDYSYPRDWNVVALDLGNDNKVYVELCPICNNIWQQTLKNFMGDKFEKLFEE